MWNLQRPSKGGEFYTKSGSSLKDLAAWRRFSGYRMPDILYKKIPSQKYVLAHFSGAPSISPFKVYPKVEEYVKIKGLKIAEAAIEIYTIQKFSSDFIEYGFPYISII